MGEGMFEARGRPRYRSMRGLAIASLALFTAACGSGEAPAGGEPASREARQAPAVLDRAALQAQAKGIFGTLPVEVPNPDNPFSEKKLKLGRMLYFDTRLSKNHDVSCNSCHDLARYGVDGEPTSAGQRGDRNSPTVYNAALHLAQFWDGRAADVEAQAKGPVLNPYRYSYA